ncbi:MULTISPECIES: DUF2500 family protein [Pirellulaceae]|nr:MULTISPECIES: DUF2500 family protein [Pirellulaceae]
MKCPSCGASLPEDSLKCEFCGSVTSTPSQLHDQDIFRRVKESSPYRQRNDPQRIERLPKPGVGSKIFLGVFFTVFCGICLMGVIMTLVMSGVIGSMRGVSGFALIPFCMGVVPLGMLGLGVYLAITQFKKMQSLETGELTTQPVIVVGKRTMVSGGSGDSSATTSYFVTFETEDGARREHQVWDGSLYGRISEEDAGVLFLREQYALDFDRVRI